MQSKVKNKTQSDKATKLCGLNFSKSPRVFSGFTLIELLTVMAIIGILSTVVLKSLNGSKQRARDAMRIDAIKTLGKSAEVYFSEHYEFPDSLDDLNQYFSNNTRPINPEPNDSDYLYMKFSKDATHPTNGYCIGVMLEVLPESIDPACPTLSTVSEYNYAIKGP